MNAFRKAFGHLTKEVPPAAPAPPADNGSTPPAPTEEQGPTRVDGIVSHVVLASRTTKPCKPGKTGKCKKRIRKSDDKIPGGLADKRKPEDFDQEALKEGIKVEMEHTNDQNIAREIAMDHLTEDPEYYKKLKTIEKSKLRKSPYGPAGMGLYNQADNARRKMSRTTEVAQIGPNSAVQATKVSAKQSAADLARKDAARSKKNPVKVWSQAEINKLMRSGFKLPKAPAVD